MTFIEWELAQYGDLPEDEMPDSVATRAERYAASYHAEKVKPLVEALKSVRRQFDTATTEELEREIDAALTAVKEER